MKLIGNPLVMRELTRVGFQSRTLMEWVLRIMANLLRPDEIGPAEAAYKIVEKISRSGALHLRLPLSPPVTRSPELEACATAV